MASYKRLDFDYCEVGALRNAILLLAVVSVPLFSGLVYSQGCPPGNPPSPAVEGSTCKMIGQVRVGTYRSIERTTGQLQAQVVGGSGDLVPKQNASIHILNDVLRMRIGFFADHNIIPRSAWLEFYSFATIDERYREGQDLTVYADGIQLGSPKIQIRRSSGKRQQLFVELPFADFIKLAGARNATIRLGDSEIELSRDVMDGLNEIRRFAKGMKERPREFCY